MLPPKSLLAGIIESGVERSSFVKRYKSEDLIDLDYVLSVGGMDFIHKIRPLFLKGATDIFLSVSENYVTGNRTAVQSGLNKLMGMANAAGALKIVRCIMTLQMMIDQGKRDFSKELIILNVQISKFDKLLHSVKLKVALALHPRS